MSWLGANWLPIVDSVSALASAAAAIAAWRSVKLTSETVRLSSEVSAKTSQHLELSISEMLKARVPERRERDRALVHLIREAEEMRFFLRGAMSDSVEGTISRMEQGGTSYIQEAVLDQFDRHVAVALPAHADELFAVVNKIRHGLSLRHSMAVERSFPKDLVELMLNNSLWKCSQMRAMNRSNTELDRTETRANDAREQ